MRKIGKPISVISTKVGIADTFLTNNYELKKNDIDIKAKPGDYVIDAEEVGERPYKLYMTLVRVVKYLHSSLCLKT